jgi:NADPH-dependent glutamate synthase beta subunit-like oxidoreductase
LRQVKSGEKPQLGEEVVVIGGGEVALDSAQTAVRLGAKKVTAVCLEDKSEMPADPEAVALARSEGIFIENCWGPKAITLNQGKASGVTLQKCTSVFDSKGAFAPCFDKCQTMELKADSVIIAVGQKRDLALLKGKEPTFNPLTLQTDEAKVFVAGDLTHGPSTVVKAMASGREAAESVHRLFTDEHLSYGRAYKGPFETEFEIDKSRGSAAERVQPEIHSCSGQGDFKEIELTMSEEQARTEAGRCYSCGKPFGKFRTCWFCLPCEVECPKDALWVDIPYLLR